MALRLLKGVRELRFVLCQSSNQSQSLRKYLAQNYEQIRESPVRISVRECENSAPVAIATFSYGIEKTLQLNKLSGTQIEEQIAKLEEYGEQLSKNIRIGAI